MRPDLDHRPRGNPGRARPEPTLTDPSAEAAEGHHRALAAVVLACGLAAFAAALVWPPVGLWAPPLQRALLAAVTVWLVHRHGLRPRWAGYLVALAWLAYALRGLRRSDLDVLQHGAVSWLMAALGPVLLAVGVGGLLSVRRRSLRVGLVLDVVVFCSAFVAIALRFTLYPVVADQVDGGTTAAVTAMLPLTSTLVVAAGVALLGVARGSRAGRTVGVALLVSAVAEPVATYARLVDDPAYADVVQAVALLPLLAASLAIAAATSPGVADLRVPSDGDAPWDSAVVVSSAAVIALAVAVWLVPGGSTNGVAAVACGFLVVSLLALADRARRAIREARRSEEHQRQLARTSSVADVANRRGLQEEVEALLAPGRTVALTAYFLDLDEFTQANERLGFARADLLLRDVATALGEVVRRHPSARLAHHGGDEFVVVQTSPLGPEAAEGPRLGRDLLELLGARGTRTLPVTASIGWSSVPLGPDREWLHVIDQAVLACSVAKEDGGGCLRRYAAEQEAARVRRRLLVERLSEAVGSRAFSTVYQPITTLDGTVRAAEALSRWDDPRLGVVTPEEFVPILESSRLSYAFDLGVLDTALADHARAGVAGAVSVNLCGPTVEDPRTVEAVRDALVRHGVRPRSLWIEVTETTVIGNLTSAATTLRALRGLGVVIALDDFGAGYSSLAYLSELPVDVIKVDGSFTPGLRETQIRQELIRSVRRIGDLFGMTLLLEHIETEEDLAIAGELGIELAQGWLFGRPVADLAQALGGSPSVGEGQDRARR